MQIKAENLVLTIKKLIEADREEEVLSLCRENDLFVTANKALVDRTKKLLLEAEQDRMATEGRSPRPARIATLSGDEPTRCQRGS